MIKHLFLSFAFFCFIINIIKGQSQISGKIVDEHHEAISFTNVLLLKVSDTQLVKGQMTDKNGLFSFTNIKDGNYIVSFSIMGYEKKKSSSFCFKNQSKFCGFKRSSTNKRT